MADSPQLPGSHAWRDSAGKPLPLEFFKFFRSLLTYMQQSGAATSDIAALTARVEELEQSGGSIGDLLGPGSVQILGDLSTGNVTVQLVNDSGNPGSSYFYGTDAAGVKGWHVLPDPPEPEPQIFDRIDTDGNIRITTDSALRIVY